MSELIACHHKVTLDIAKRDVCTIEVVNRDTANILEVNVCENGKEVSLENATLITITYSNDTVEEMQISEDFKTASVRINANCLKRGINFAKVCIYSGDNGLITAEMLTINCKQTVGSDNPSVPDPDMPKLKEMIAELVKQSASSEQIAAAVSQYLKDNPIIETDPTVPAWAKEKNKPTYTAAEVGALSRGTLDAAINDALAAAKASGEFDGKSAYSYAQDGGYTGTEAEFAAKLAAEKPPTPRPLACTGAVNETYDGSSAKTIEIPSGGGGGLGDFELIGTVDFSQDGMAVASGGVTFEVTDVSEIVLVYNDLVNSTSSQSSVKVYLNISSEHIESGLCPDSGKSGVPLNGWVFIKPLPGVGLTGIQSSSAVSATNYTLGNAKTPYNIIPLASDFRITKISIQNPPTQYYAVGGTVKVYAR